MRKFKTFYMHLNLNKDKELIEKLTKIEEAVKDEIQDFSISCLLKAIINEAVNNVEIENVKKYIKERKEEKRHFIADSLARKASSLLT